MDNDAGFDEVAGRSTAARKPNLTPLLTLAAVMVAVPAVALGVVLCAVVPGVPWWLGVPVGAAVAVGLVLLRLRNAYPALLQGLGASTAGPDDQPRFHNLVQGLSPAEGVAEPELYVIDDTARNAAALAGGGRSGIVATTGLLSSLDRIGLEAVVAEGLVRIGNGDAEAATVAAALFGPLLGGPLAGLGELGLRRALPVDRELVADRAAVALTRYPPGLSAALAAIGQGSARVPGVGDRLDHVWLVPPSSVESSPGPRAPAAPLSLRIDVLTELY